MEAGLGGGNVKA